MAWGQKARQIWTNTECEQFTQTGTVWALGLPLDSRKKRSWSFTFITFTINSIKRNFAEIHKLDNKMNC